MTEALEQEIEYRRRRREVGVGPFYGEPQQLTIRTAEEYSLHLDALHAVEIPVGNSFVVKVWEQEGKVYPSRVVEGRITYLGPERRKMERGLEHDVTFNLVGKEEKA